MGREDRLYHCIAAVDWSLRHQGCPRLDPHARRELYRMALNYGRVGWEAAMRALHKVNKRAWDYDRREGPLSTAVGLLAEQSQRLLARGR